MWTRHSCPGSRDVFGFEPFELLFDRGEHTAVLTGEVGQSAKPCHPRRLFLRTALMPGRAAKLLLQRFGEQLPEGHATAGSHYLGRSERFVRELDGRLHRTIFPYLRRTVLLSPAPSKSG